MLKRKLKLDPEIKYEPLELYDLYRSPDLSFVSGATNLRYCLSSGNMVRYQLDSGSLFYESPLSAYTAVRQGYIIYKKMFPVNKTTYYGKDITYIDYFGTIYYAHTNESGETVFTVSYEKNGEPDCYSFENPHINIVDEEVEYNGTDEEVYVGVVSYIENGIVNIDGNDYLVDLTQAGSGTSAYTDFIRYNYLSDSYIDITEHSLWGPNDWLLLTKFVFEPDDNILLDVNSAYTIENKLYVMVGGTEYDFYTNDESSLSGNVMINYNGREIGLDSVKSCLGVMDIYGVNVPSEKIKLSDGNYCQVKSYRRVTELGDMLSIVMDQGRSDLGIGSTIIAKSLNMSYEIADVEVDSDGNEYVMFCGNRYDVLAGYDRCIVINNTEYPIIYQNGEYCAIEMDEQVVPLKKNESNWERIGPITANTTSYTEVFHDAIVINNEKYRVTRDGEHGYVRISKPTRYEFNIEAISGLSTYYLTPILNTAGMSECETEQRRIDICSEIGANPMNYLFYLKNTIIGKKKVTYKNVYDEQMPNNPDMEPISSDDVVSPSGSADVPYVKKAFNETFVMYKVIDYFSIPITLSNIHGNNVLMEDMIRNGVVSYHMNGSIPSTIDMEKDVYHPAIDVEVSENNTISDSRLARFLEFNLHFRTRDMDTWKINEEGTMKYSSNMTNWNIVDNQMYLDLIEGGGDTNKLMRSADLLYYLKFNNSDIYRQKKKLEKSFIRLSFYNSTDPSNQFLLATSTIFIDESEQYMKYSSNQKNGRFRSVYFGSESTSIGVDMEPIGSDGNPSLDNDKRICARFTVTDKNTTTTSSEGYYLYMFKEYSNGLRIGTVYMSVEFYHAGLGKIIPFYVPTKKDDAGSHLLTLNNEDIGTLKAGIGLSNLYRELYIPFDVSYDFKNKRYIYYLKEGYKFDNDEDAIIINLFETKIRNDS